MKFEVVMTVYNTPEVDLLESVTSLLRQSYQGPWTLTLVNDASTNADTLRMIDYLHRNHDRIRVMHLPENVGEAAALNAFHEQTDVEWIAKCDSDDVFHVDKFQKQIDFIKENPHASVVGTNLWAFKDKDFTRTSIFKTTHPLIGKPVETDNGLDWWFVNHGSVFYRNKDVKDAGGYTNGLRFAYDIDLWARMYARGCKFYNLAECLYAWRRYDIKFMS